MAGSTPVSGGKPYALTARISATSSSPIRPIRTPDRAVVLDLLPWQPVIDGNVVPARPIDPARDPRWVELIAAHDPEAARTAMQAHLDGVASFWREHPHGPVPDGDLHE